MWELLILRVLIFVVSTTLYCIEVDTKEIGMHSKVKRTIFELPFLTGST